jgi:hypothetical protein
MTPRTFACLCSADANDTHRFTTAPALGLPRTCNHDRRQRPAQERRKSAGAPVDSRRCLRTSTSVRRAATTSWEVDARRSANRQPRRRWKPPQIVAWPSAVRGIVSRGPRQLVGAGATRRSAKSESATGRARHGEKRDTAEGRRTAGAPATTGGPRRPRGPASKEGRLSTAEIGVLADRASTRSEDPRRSRSTRPGKPAAPVLGTIEGRRVAFIPRHGVTTSSRPTRSRTARTCGR